MKKITYQHKTGKGGSVSAETAERKKAKTTPGPVMDKKSPQPAVDQKKEG